MPAVVRGAIVASVLAFTLAAAAQQPAAQGDAAQRAQTLFNNGRAALDRGDIAGACSMLSESLALVKRPSTLYNLAQCEAKQGKLRSAAEHMKGALDTLEPGDPRVPLARAQLAELDQQLPRLALQLAPGTPAGCVVLVDDVQLEAASIGTQMTLDPGEHRLVVRVPGREEAATVVKLAPGDRRSVTLATGAPLPTTSSSPPPAAAAPPERASNTKRTLGWVIGGVGAAGLVAGGVTGMMALGKKNEMEDNCAGACNDAARDAADSGRTLALLSTVSFAVGLAGVGVGSYLLLTSPSKEPASPSVAIAPTTLPRGAGLSIQGSF
ncbi:MAG: tetratricopeptide repeat protein [Deltaproteobacteria bacterium]|nr:tetratricopeptide repeat protein [Deltaproteobacteria bacterium]